MTQLLTYNYNSKISIPGYGEDYRNPLEVCSGAPDLMACLEELDRKTRSILIRIRRRSGSEEAGNYSFLSRNVEKIIL